MRRFGAAIASSFLLAVSVSGCAAKDDATLVVSAKGPALAKLPGPFDAKLDGSVDVSFDLGHWSGSNVTVESIQIGLYRSGAQIIPGAKIEPQAGTVFPLVMAPSETRVIHYTIVKEQLLKDEVTTLCAGPITITGVVKQSGKPDLTILADPISASGCP
ncbi:MAG: hypothetical protein ACXVEF_22410 [Polyangiales bacterium]